ncbi:hypothetical protein HBB16_03265 [Pseudonocardia sp. MCCB 268]|nr:hypothetical protein [Pseudonocardia cytotoxica]
MPYGVAYHVAPGAGDAVASGPPLVAGRADRDRQPLTWVGAAEEPGGRWSTPTPCSCGLGLTSAPRSCRSRRVAGSPAPPARRARRPVRRRRWSVTSAREVQKW